MDPFDIRHSRYEYLAVLIRSALVLGIIAFPGLIDRINKISHLLAFPEKKEIFSDIARYLYENFWSVQYPLFLTSMSLKRDKTNMTINQLTYNLLNLFPKSKLKLVKGPYDFMVLLPSLGAIKFHIFFYKRNGVVWEKAPTLFIVVYLCG